MAIPCFAASSEGFNFGPADRFGEALIFEYYMFTSAEWALTSSVIFLVAISQIVLRASAVTEACLGPAMGLESWVVGRGYPPGLDRAQGVQD